MIRMFRAGITAGTLLTGAALFAPAPVQAAASERAATTDQATAARAATPTGAAAAERGAAPTGSATAVRAGVPTFRRLVAYVRDGNIYVSQGAAERAITRGGGYSRPRWSPNGGRIAYLRAGLLSVMNADGTGQVRLSDRPAAGPAWSPDGRWLAFAAPGCSGGPAIYRISAVTPNSRPEVLFPADCRGEALPPVTRPVPASGTLAQRLRRDDAVAWSPDGTRIAFRGGQCESTYDDCLSLGTVASGGERVLAAYGGGGHESSGFAVVPAFRADGVKVAWTAYQVGHDAASTLPIHVVEYDLARGGVRRVGAAEDRELAYESATRALVTGTYRNSTWILAVDLRSGVRVPFHPGSQPSIQP